ncbi:ABC transporter ATP-binding protein [Leucobacter sp. M11]|nr:ABC transporter ATP-binding protein [Leucobacter sp. M11]MEB4613661.1 ABC transporter ATP-binding protein [Leucobacter sp. M11]
MLALLGAHRAGVAAVLLFTSVSVLLAVLAPKVLGMAIDVIHHGVTGAGVDFVALSRLILVVLGLYVVSSVLMWAQGYLLNDLTMRVMFRLREDVEAKLNRLPLNYFDTRTRGDVISRVTNDVDNIQTALQDAFAQLVQSVLTILGITVMMFIVSWPLALLTLLLLPVAAVLLAVIGSKSQRKFSAQWEQTGAVNGHVEETLSGLEVIRAFGTGTETLREFDNRNEALTRATFGAQALSGTIMPTMTFVSSLSYVLIAVAGGVRVAAGQMTLGDAVAFIQYSREFTQPLSEMTSVANMLQSGVASVARTFELLDAAEERADTAPDPASEPDGGPVSAPPEPASGAGAGRGRVSFDSVRFGYAPEHPLITGLSLEVAPGQTVAIVGPTGAGKSTLVNLLMRFYEIDGGSIRLDGTDTRDLSRQELRARTGMVLQDAWLFTGTIRENIRYGRLAASDAEVEAAARATLVDRFVQHLPAGYDTVVGDEDSSLSAGERQLITIARAFLAQPDVLILDEATSSVDTRTERLVQEAMAALRSGRTSFVIAHRLSTIRDADTILVLQDGDIVEQGTHDELLASDGHYGELYAAQQQGASA